MFSRALAACLCVAIGGTAQAAWNRASSEHFIIYSEEEPAKLRDFALRLEKFDAAARVLRKADDPAVGDGNRVTVFVVSNENAVRKLARAKGSGVAGFYNGRASGSIAVVPRKMGDKDLMSLDSETVLFHEYSHHLMLRELDRPVPHWLREGFAEFLATAAFEKDGAVGLGIYPAYRFYELRRLQPIGIEKMLGASYEKLRDDEFYSLYARGWLTLHYLTFEPTRQGQLERYLGGIARGQPALTAAQEAFGDLGKFDGELDRYAKRGKLTYARIGPEKLAIGAVDVTPLSAGGSAVMPLRIRSKVGLAKNEVAPFAAEVRAIAARYSGDPFVQVTLAEAEFDANNFAGAEAAADRALAVDPRMGEAMLFKGQAIVGAAKTAAKGTATTMRFDTAREWFIKANAIDKEDPEPLLLFYRSFVEQGIAPTRNAVAALHYASNLAPQDTGVRMSSAAQYLRDGKGAEARRVLAPLAFDPHQRGTAKIAAAMMVLIDQGNLAGAAAKADEKREEEDAKR